MQTRKTFQKALTFDAVKALKNHPTADEVYACVSTQYPEISRATVYRNLNYLCETGSVYRVKVADGADHFDHQTHPHYHFKCNACGRVEDIDVPYIESLNQECEMKSGYKITDHQIFFDGLCDICAVKKAN